MKKRADSGNLAEGSSSICCQAGKLFVIVLFVVFHTALAFHIFGGSAVVTRGGNSDNAVPVIIFKLPRTGSSWFTQELNAIPKVYISKEIVQRRDRAKFSAAEIEAQLIRALTKPTGKMSSKDKLMPDGRYVEDYLLHRSFKVLRSLDVIGFTVNPEHCEGINWSNVVAAVPQVKVVIYMRTNVIKTAVSGHRGKEMKKVCGDSNLKQLSLSKCSISPSVNWTVAEFGEQVAYWQNRQDSFFKFFHGEKALKSLPTLKLYYESLQENADASFQEMFTFLERSETYSKYLSASPMNRQRMNGLVKRSPEDLSKLLVNYDEIKQQLVSSVSKSQLGFNCSCWRDQLVETSTKVFPRCAMKIHGKDGCIPGVTEMI